MKLKVGFPCDCTAGINQRNLIVEKITTPCASLKLSGLDIVNNIATALQNKHPFPVFLSLFLITVCTHKFNFHSSFERTACTPFTKWSMVKLYLEGVRLSEVTQCNLFLFTKLSCSQIPYASMYIFCWQHFILPNKLQKVLTFYLYIKKYPLVFGLSFQNEKKVNRQKEVQHKGRDFKDFSTRIQNQLTEEWIWLYKIGIN